MTRSVCRFTRPGIATPIAATGLRLDCRSWTISANCGISVFGSDLADPRLAKRSVVVDERGARVGTRNTNADEICLWSGHGNKLGLGWRSCVDEE